MNERRKANDLDGKAGAAKKAIFVAAGALCLGIAFLAAIVLLASCSASVASAIRADGGASISFQAEVPAPLAARFRKLASAVASSQGGAGQSAGPFFDAAAVRSSIAAKPGLTLVALEQPSPDSIRVEVSARSLEELAALPDLKGSGLISVSRGPGWAECRIRLERGGAKAVSALFPGIDPMLMDSLSPPALEEDPVTVAQYTTSLRSILGEKAMPAMESAAISLSLAAPGTVLAYGGGSLSGSTLTAKIPAIQALTLEKPIEIWLRWKQ
jgi:hypothetical protein